MHKSSLGIFQAVDFIFIRLIFIVVCDLHGAHYTLSVVSSSSSSQGWRAAERYNPDMPDFRFQHAIEVRYGDLDPQGHVNNAKFFTYIEQARITYVLNLGLWDGKSFFDIGIILAEARITFHAPIHFGQWPIVFMRVSRLGNKSLTMQYLLVDRESGENFATGESIQVAYDYRQQTTIEIPARWRKVIAEFESLENG